jgi:hypothetical protein
MNTSMTRSQPKLYYNCGNCDSVTHSLTNEAYYIPAETVIMLTAFR